MKKEIDKWGSLLQEAIESQDPNIPENAYTFEELRERYDFGENKLRKILKDLVEDKQIYIYETTVYSETQKRKVRKVFYVYE